MQNKRGQGLSTNAIILIVLGVIVLVILAIGFMAGWEKIAPWMSKDNVDTIIQQCEVACTTNSVYSYCSKERDLNDGENKVTGTCEIFQESNKYGMASCNIQCSNVGVIYEDKATSQKWCEDEEEEVRKDIRVYYFEEGVLNSEKCSAMNL